MCEQIAREKTEHHIDSDILIPAPKTAAPLLQERLFKNVS